MAPTYCQVILYEAYVKCHLFSAVILKCTECREPIFGINIKTFYFNLFSADVQKLLSEGEPNFLCIIFILLFLFFFSGYPEMCWMRGTNIGQIYIEGIRTLLARPLPQMCRLSCPAHRQVFLERGPCLLQR